MDIREFTEIINQSGIKSTPNEQMSRHTTMKTGGEASVAVFPKNTDELVRSVKAARLCGAEYTVIGNGSNVLFPDDRYDGVVIFTSGCREVEINKMKISADCGASLTQLSALSASASLSGLEFAYGIPGSVGGAVFMNAGAYGGEISTVLTESLCYNAISGEFITLDNAEHKFSYRKSVFSEHPELLIIKSHFLLVRGDKVEINAKNAELMAKRRDKQPLEYPSSGSAFKRPEGLFAGKLIEEAGLKGFSVGGAQVSEKHAGFIVNRGGATTSDIIALIGIIKNKVFDNSGVILESEIRFID